MRPKRRSMLEQALASPSTTPRGLPAMVPTCHFFECEEPAPRGLTQVGVFVKNSPLMRWLEYVPLCEPHLTQHAVTGRLTLKYHPDERAA